ncbi:galactoside-binding lectin [Teladorsagia circumcincta]|uniref:Galectin n=1 Tax=Teladorsagia circumcincta TaxID=45464 RepID=A0A2G9UI20_TELCI|nr:galactoside-binding lectin [Teladorsagia circumcincta]
MAAAPQRFPLPNMPFRREIHSGCAIGTSISFTAQAFRAKEKSFTVQLSTAKDIAILVTVPIAKSGKITASARIDGKFTSEVDTPIIVPLETKFTMQLRTTQYVTEIFFNNTHKMDFVHRVSPTDIREVSIEGPLIVEEVVFTPPQGAMLDPLPSYEQATTSGVLPVVDLQRMNLGQPGAAQPLIPTPLVLPAPSAYTLTPTPGPPQIGLSPSILNQPMPGVPLAPTPSGTVGKTSDRSSSSSLNPFLQDTSTSKPPIYENSPKYVPTAFQVAQSTSTSSNPTPYYVTFPPEASHPPQPSQQSQQPQPYATQPIQPYQSPPYPTVPQAGAMAPYPSSSQSTTVPHTSSSQAPSQAPFVPQQQNFPRYAPQYYGNYPVMYGSGCHGVSDFHYRRSNSCCSD